MTITSEQRVNRVNSIGGSDISCIFGLNPYKSICQLWAEKTGIISLDDDSPISEAAYWGNILEPIVIKEFEKRNNVKVEILDTIIHSKYPFMTCNLDGYIREWDAILEAKCTGAFTKGWGAPGTDEIPLQNLLQVAHNSACTDVMEAHIPVFIGDLSYKQYRFYRDFELEDKIIKAASEFWDSVKNNIVPIPIDEKDVKALYPRSEAKSILINDKIIPIYDNLMGVRKTIKELEQLEKQYRFEIMAYMETCDCLIDSDNNEYVSYRSNKNGVRSFLPKIIKTN